MAETTTSDLDRLAYEVSRQTIRSKDKAIFCDYHTAKAILHYLLERNLLRVEMIADDTD